MPKLIQIDFRFNGPFGDRLAGELKELAASIAGEPGLLWKIWTENESAREAGGIYLFEDEESARAFLGRHMARLKGFGVEAVNAKVFDVNVPLTRMTNGPIGTPE